jgi:hypothetical protein
VKYSVGGAKINMVLSAGIADRRSDIDRARLSTSLPNRPKKGAIPS